MDIPMPGVNGIEATPRILQASSHIRVLILTMFEDEASVFTAMRAGARGYVLKDAEKEDIVRAVLAVGRGEAIFSPDVATRIVDFFASARPCRPQRRFPSADRTPTGDPPPVREGSHNWRSAARHAIWSILEPKAATIRFSWSGCSRCRRAGIAAMATSYRIGCELSADSGILVTLARCRSAQSPSARWRTAAIACRAACVSKV
jgi:Response regulator receiver domain